MLESRSLHAQTESRLSRVSHLQTLSHWKRGLLSAAMLAT